MNSKRRVPAVLVLLFFSIPTVKYAMASPEDAPQKDQVKIRAAIANTVERFLDAWNKHDAHDFAMTFKEDADFTNVGGAPLRRGLLNGIMARQSDGSWLIQVMHNTKLTSYPKQTK